MSTAGSSSCRDRERPLFLLSTEDLRALVFASRKRKKWGRYPLSLCYLQPGTSCSGISDLAETSSACPLATSILVQGYAQRLLFKHAHNKLCYVISSWAGLNDTHAQSQVCYDHSGTFNVLVSWAAVRA